MLIHHVPKTGGIHGVIAAMKDKYHELLYLEAQLDVGENANLL